jgi:hypothetical protein
MNVKHIITSRLEKVNLAQHTKKWRAVVKTVSIKRGKFPYCGMVSLSKRTCSMH